LCDLCKSVADKAIEAFKNSEDKIKDLLEQVCNYTNQRDTCIDTIEQNWDDIKEMIEGELDSQLLCSALNMCQQEEEGFNDYQMTLMAGFAGPLLEPQLETEPLNSKDDHIKFIPEHDIHKTQSVVIGKSSKDCNDCVQFGVDIKAVATSDEKLEQLVQTIQIVCEEIEMRSLCRLVLNRKVIKRIIDKIDVIKVCHDVEICQPGDTPILPSAGESCLDCNNMITDIKDLAQNDFDKFEDMIRQSCDLIPHPVNDMCKKMADRFAQEAAHSLSIADTEECCEAISLCDASNNNPETDHLVRFQSKAYNWPENKIYTGKYCDYCETAVEYIQYAVDSDMTSDQIKAGLKQLCDKLQPDSVAETCEEFVDKYWEQLVDDMDIILNDPEHVCEKLHLCRKTKFGQEDDNENLMFPPECTYGPEYWCKNEENMKKCGAEDYCKNLIMQEATAFPSECTFGPEYWCRNEENMKKCGAEDYCKKDRKEIELVRSKRSLLGAKKCTWGPSHWCASAENAEECGMVDWCTEKQIGFFAV